MIVRDASKFTKCSNMDPIITMKWILIRIEFNTPASKLRDQLTSDSAAKTFGLRSRTEFCTALSRDVKRIRKFYFDNEIGRFLFNLICWSFIDLNTRISFFGNKFSGMFDRGILVRKLELLQYKTIALIKSI